MTSPKNAVLVAVTILIILGALWYNSCHPEKSFMSYGDPPLWERAVCFGPIYTTKKVLTVAENSPVIVGLFEQYRSLANSGDIDAQIKLAELYLTGNNGVTQSFYDAYFWFSIVAEYTPADSRTAALAADQRNAILQNLSAEDRLRADEAVKKWTPQKKTSKDSE